jgi:hypothetical protein
VTTVSSDTARNEATNGVAERSAVHARQLRTDEAGDEATGASTNGGGPAPRRHRHGLGGTLGEPGRIVRRGPSGRGLSGAGAARVELG